MSYNDITGDKITTKVVTDQYRENYDQIFNKKLAEDIEKAGKEKLREFMELEGIKSIFPGTNPNVTPEQIMDQIQKVLEEMKREDHEYDMLMCSECGNTGVIIDYYNNQWPCHCTKGK